MIRRIFTIISAAVILSAMFYIPTVAGNSLNTYEFENLAYMENGICKYDSVMTSGSRTFARLSTSCSTVKNLTDSNLSSVDFAFTIAESGNYELSADVRISTANDKGDSKWYIDGDEVRYYTYYGSYPDQWLTLPLGTMYLEAGEHTFRYFCGYGSETAPGLYDLDKFTAEKNRNKMIFASNEFVSGNLTADVSVGTFANFLGTDLHSFSRIQNAAVGESMTFYIDNDYYGDYKIDFFEKGGSDRGILDLYIDDNFIGEIDSASITTWGALSFGTATIPTGRRKITIRTVGDASGCNIVFSYMKFTNISDGLLVSEPVVTDDNRNAVNTFTEYGAINIDCYVGNYIDSSAGVGLVAAHYSKIEGYDILKGVSMGAREFEPSSSGLISIRLGFEEIAVGDFVRIFTCDYKNGILIPKNNDVYLNYIK